MFQINLKEEINAPQAVVWDVITRTADYPKWNKFVVACESTFQVGSPIVMKVKVLPFMPMRQKETILKIKPGEFLEYGIDIPFGILSSSRQHILKAIDSDRTTYESVFILNGLLSSLVGFLLGTQLNRGFRDMTKGIASRSLEIHAQRKG